MFVRGEMGAACAGRTGLVLPLVAPSWTFSNRGKRPPLKIEFDPTDSASLRKASAGRQHLHRMQINQMDCTLIVPLAQVLAPALRMSLIRPGGRFRHLHRSSTNLDSPATRPRKTTFLIPLAVLSKSEANLSCETGSAPTLVLAVQFI
jgi:hypothetical protein